MRSIEFPIVAILCDISFSIRSAIAIVADDVVVAVRCLLCGRLLAVAYF